MSSVRESKHQPSRIEKRRCRILVIEDNEQNLYLTTFLLEKCGYEIVQARDGRQGIELAGSVKPDMILLDIQLPGTDGYAVARELRRNPLLDRVPIVAVTSYAMVGDRERILAVGCEGYIEKPINPETFTSEIEAFLFGNRPTATKPAEGDNLLQAGLEVRCDEDTDR